MQVQIEYIKYQSTHQNRSKCVCEPKLNFDALVSCCRMITKSIENVKSITAKHSIKYSLCFFLSLSLLTHKHMNELGCSQILHFVQIICLHFTSMCHSFALRYTHHPNLFVPFNYFVYVLSIKNSLTQLNNWLDESYCVIP